LLQEEERLRKLEKMRQAGELQSKTKSAVDRSTESVALRLMKQPDEIDAMQVLREAANQQELKFAQRNLATVQRRAQKYELPNKVLKEMPHWIAKEAQLQAEWVAERKKEKGLPKTGKTDDSVGSIDDIDDIPDASLFGEIEVECRTCGKMFAWEALRVGDGSCASCCSGSVSPFDKAAVEFGTATASSSTLKGSRNQGAVSQAQETCGEDLMVECAECGSPALWSILSLGDGKCPSCFAGSGSSSTACSTEPSSKWRRHRSEVAALEAPSPVLASAQLR